MHPSCRFPASILRLVVLTAYLALGCEDPAAPRAPEPAQARQPGRPEITEMLRAGAAAHYAPSDGGGRAWLVRDADQPPHTTASSLDRFRIVFETGPLGVATGGAVYLLVSPFWEWSPPQTQSPEAPGYIEVTGPDDATLSAAVVDDGLLALEVTGRPLAVGDRIEILYGAGPALARTDRYAERDERFWVSVDGDGDGTRAPLLDSPRIDVLPGPAARLSVYAPTIARPGDTARIVVALTDANHNAGPAIETTVHFEPLSGLGLPASLTLTLDDAGRGTLEVPVHEAGLYRIRARADEFEATSNPMLASPDGPLVLWGDLHGHSNFSDGTGIPEDYYTYARDVSALDVAALTDHDHWGMRPLVDHPELWEDIRTQARRFHEPGRFVTLLGFEWTSWIYGHRHVLYFGDEGEVYDSVSREFESPIQLWDALAESGHEALTFAHHSGGGPVETDWDIVPDPRFEPLVEIVSIHGSSEALRAPDVLHGPVPGHFVRDALARGYPLGFVGSGDRHDGHPGLYEPGPPAQGGLAAIIASARTREAVLEALRARRTYATNGARILLRSALGGEPMGSRISLGEGAPWSADLYVQVMGSAPLESVELIRSGAVASGLGLEGRLEAELHHTVEDLEAGEYVYVRVIQQDGGMAWSSPFFLEP